MAVGMLFLIIIGIIAALLLLLIFVVKMTSMGNELPKDQKRELVEAKRLIKEIERTARQNKDVYPEMSWMIIDQIDQSSLKELN